MKLPIQARTSSWRWPGALVGRRLAGQLVGGLLDEPADELGVSGHHAVDLGQGHAEDPVVVVGVAHGQPAGHQELDRLGGLEGHRPQRRALHQGPSGAVLLDLQLLEALDLDHVPLERAP